MTIRPLGDYVVIKPVEAAETTASGIVLPGSSKDRPERGEVLEVGSGRLLDNGNRAPIEVKKGDTVLFKKYAPDEFDLDGQKVMMVEASSIIAIID